MEKRIVKGIWIPIEIWEDKTLTWNEKILLIEIDSFTSQDKNCYFSDKYIAELLTMPIQDACKTLSSLIAKGYIIKIRRKKSISCRTQFSKSKENKNSI